MRSGLIPMNKTFIFSILYFFTFKLICISPYYWYKNGYCFTNIYCCLCSRSHDLWGVWSKWPGPRTRRTPVVFVPDLVVLAFSTQSPWCLWRTSVTFFPSFPDLVVLEDSEEFASEPDDQDLQSMMSSEDFSNCLSLYPRSPSPRSSPVNLLIRTQSP